jgi:hypothetical protein
MSRVIGEFEGSLELIKQCQSKGPNIKHHEQVKSVQSTFTKQVTALCDTLEKMGNPFMEDSHDLLVLDTKDIADKEVVATIQNIERVGQEKFASFIEERLDQRTKSLFDTIPKNKFPL